MNIVNTTNHVSYLGASATWNLDAVFLLNLAIAAVSFVLFVSVMSFPCCKSYLKRPRAPVLHYKSPRLRTWYGRFFAFLTAPFAVDPGDIARQLGLNVLLYLVRI